MSSKPRNDRSRSWLRVILPALGLALAVFPLPPRRAGAFTASAAEETADAAPSRTVVVGGSEIRWHLDSSRAAGAPAAPHPLLAEYRALTAARLIGEKAAAEAQSPAAEVEVETLDNGYRRVRVPAELIHTMFVRFGPGGQPAPFCAQGTRAEHKAAAGLPKSEEK